MNTHRQIEYIPDIKIPFEKETKPTVATIK